MSQIKDTTATIVPNLAYKDAPKAIDWLCEAFGLAKHMVIPDESGLIVHAQLKFGNGMVMISSARESVADKILYSPDEVDGKNTQGLYLVVTDADAHFAQAKNAGAKIVREPQDQPYGGRDYTCLDLEGNLWSFGTYDPWI